MIKIKQSKIKKTKKVSELNAGEFFKFNSDNTIDVMQNRLFIKAQGILEDKDGSYCYDLSTNMIYSLEDDLDCEVIILKQINEIEFAEEI